jgi:hypothetical protein
MERRDFLKFALGAAASAAVLGARAQAAPLAPHSLNDDALRAAGPEARADAHPAVATEDEVDHLKPMEVRWGHGHHYGWGHGHHYGWGHGHHYGWGRRHWGWHHRHWGWHRRHWGWRRRWHHRYWHRRYW